MRRSVPIWVLVAALAVTVLVGIGAYNAGVSEGLAQNIDAGGGNAELVRYVGHGRGFGFFPLGLLLFPLLFFGFFLLMGAAFGRGARGFGPGRWGGGPGRDDRPSFEDWHRRQHERQGETGSGGEPTGSSTG